MNIETFLAQYPDIQPDEYSIGTEYDFNKLLFQKKEFHDLKIPKNPPEQVNDFYNHQKIVARFLMSYTLYDELLLFHSPGTGKTFTSIHTIESILESNSTIKKAVIIVPNETLVERFKQEILFVGTNKKYLPSFDEDDEFLRPDELYQKQYAFGKRRLKGIYNITTHERFYNELKLLEQFPEKIKTQYSNSIIVIDEAHRVANSIEWYPQYFKLLHEVENRKILLMTGTPMKNNVSEIASLMNLILPMDLLFPTGKVFEMEYLNDGMIKIDREKDIEKRFLGRISYLKAQSNIPYTFIGEKIKGFTYPVIQHTMSEHQQKSFSQIQTNKETFYKESLQASLFVFDDGTYGMDGYNKNIKEFDDHRFSYPILQKLQKLPFDEKLIQLGKYSTKFQNAITSILSNPNENTFVYSYFMRGSGAIVFGLCLEMFGFTRASGKNIKDERPKKRYAILSDSVGTDVSSILRIFNSYENRYGDLIQVLIGGKQIEEGVTFYSIQQVHILTPTWNLSSLDQTLARGIRIKSHRFLPQNTMVKVYLHVSCTDKGDYMNNIQSSRIEYDHSNKMVLFTYNTTTLEKDIKTILNTCNTDPQNKQTVYYIKIQNKISEQLIDKCIEYGLSHLITTPSTIHGVNGITYTVKSHETLFYTPYIDNIYSNIVSFYNQEVLAFYGILLTDTTIMTVTNIPWTSFKITNQDEKEEFDFKDLPDKTYTILENQENTIFILFKYLPISGAQKVLPSLVYKNYMYQYLFSINNKDTLYRFDNPYMYMYELNRTLVEEQAQLYIRTIQNIRFIVKYKYMYMTKYETLLDIVSMESILSKLTNTMRKKLVTKKKLIPNDFYKKTTGEVFISTINDNIIQFIWDKIKDDPKHILFPILQKTTLDEFRKILQNKPSLLDTCLHLYGWSEKSTPYLDYFIRTIDFSNFKSDVFDMMVKSNIRFDIPSYNMDDVFLSLDETIDKIIKYIEPYGLTFPFTIPNQINSLSETIGTPIVTFNSKGQLRLVGMNTSNTKGIMFSQLKIKKPEMDIPQSTDFQLYIISQQKDYAIKRIEYLIKINAFDCALTFEQNQQIGEKGRECEYSDCIYRCKGIPDEIEVDKSTYQLFFKNDYEENLRQILQIIFKSQFSITLWELFELLQKKYTLYQICDSIQSIIRKYVVFKNKFGLDSYLQEDRNIFFLTTRIYDSNYNNAYYTEHPVITHSLDFMDTVEYLLYSDEEINRKLLILGTLSDNEKQKKIPTLSIIVQEAFIENAIVAVLQNKMTPMVVWILQHYKKYIHIDNQKVYSTFLNVRREYMKTDKDSYEWVTVETNSIEVSRHKQLIYSEHGIYGYENELNQFIIVNLFDVPMDLREKESKKRGKNCITHKLKELVKITQILNIPIPNNPKKGVLCRILKTWLTENDLIF